MKRLAVSLLVCVMTLATCAWIQPPPNPSWDVLITSLSNPCLHQRTLYGDYDEFDLEITTTCTDLGSNGKVRVDIYLQSNIFWTQYFLTGNNIYDTRTFHIQSQSKPTVLPHWWGGYLVDVKLYNYTNGQPPTVTMMASDQGGSSHP